MYWKQYDYDKLGEAFACRNVARIFRDAQRIVIKLGTSTITYPNGRLNLDRMERIVRQIADIANEGREVIVVSSGAVGAGVGRLGLTHRPKTIPEKQAAAAVGQGLLMQTYEKLFSEYGHTVAQVLLTRADINDRRRHLNARHALSTLLQYNAIPIINENDTIAVEEIKFGDNDTLAALVTGLVNAELLVLLSDVDGLYDADPRTNPQAKRLSVVTNVTPELAAAAAGPGTAMGSGGMATKVEAARIAMQSGAAMVIVDGREPSVIRELINGTPHGTLFVPQQQPLEMRKRWLAFFQTPHGKVVIDEGAKQALIEQGRSLLPIGIVEVHDQFEEGDLISVYDTAGREVARGLANYAADLVEKMKGLSTRDIENNTQLKLHYEEIIHRDNLVVVPALSEEEHDVANNS